MLIHRARKHVVMMLFCSKKTHIYKIKLYIYICGLLVKIIINMMWTTHVEKYRAAKSGCVVVYIECYVETSSCKTRGYVVFYGFGLGVCELACASMCEDVRACASMCEHVRACVTCSSEMSLHVVWDQGLHYCISWSSVY